MSRPKSPRKNRRRTRRRFGAECSASHRHQCQSRITRGLGGCQRARSLIRPSSFRCRSLWRHGNRGWSPFTDDRWCVFVLLRGFEKSRINFCTKEEDQQHHTELVNAIENETVDMVQYEKKSKAPFVPTLFSPPKSLSSPLVQDRPFMQQLGVLVGISLLMTVGVYGLVGGIVKLDDVGLWLLQKRAASHKHSANSPYGSCHA